MVRGSGLAGFDGAVVVAVAERFLDDAVSVYPGGCFPCDVEIENGFDGFAFTSGEENSVAAEGSGAGVLSDLVEMLLERAFKVERDLAEVGHVVMCATGYGSVLMLDDDGHLCSNVGAVIPDGSGGTFVVKLDVPVVDEVIRGCRECSVTDRIRIFGQLVRFFRDAVGFHGSVETFPSGFVSGFGKAIGVLTDAVSAYRDEQADYADDSTNQTSGGTNNAEGGGVHSSNSSSF